MRTFKQYLNHKLATKLWLLNNSSSSRTDAASATLVAIKLIEALHSYRELKLANKRATQAELLDLAEGKIPQELITAYLVAK